METVNNLAAAASKAIWGEQPAEDTTVPKSTSENETKGQEPLSGVQGDVAKGEPFDKGNDEPSTSASTKETESVLESTKVLPLRPAGEAPASNENIKDSSFGTGMSAGTSNITSIPGSSIEDADSKTDSRIEELKEKALPTIPATHSTTPNSTSTPANYQNITNLTPFLAGLQGADTSAVQGAGGAQLPGAKTVDSPVGVGAGVVGESEGAFEKKETVGADTSAVKGAGGAQIPGAKVADAKIADSEEAAENARLPPKTESLSHTSEKEVAAPIVPPKTIGEHATPVTSAHVTPSSAHAAPSSGASAAPIVPSKVDSEESGVSHEGKEKLSLKDKIKAKLHHHKD